MWQKLERLGGRLGDRLSVRFKHLIIINLIDIRAHN